jgi:MFS transporter, BCD family, chlorophyll transporter
MNETPLGWISILRLGLVQTALGAIVVMMTSTINRVMVVELALPAIAPGLLVALHYAVQILRPAWGYGSDKSGRRTPWIIGGMATLACGGVGAAIATALMASHLGLGLVLATLSFLCVGVGVGAAGTSTLAMLASRVAPSRRAAAATTVWVMMIAGFAATAPIAGHYLDPFSPARLIVVTTCVAAAALLVAVFAVFGVENRVATSDAPRLSTAKPPFRKAFAEVWREPAARRLTIFIFVSMLAYSAQELLVEPFAGLVFGMTPGATTQLAGVQHGGVLTGMLLVAIAASTIGGPILGSLRLWTVGGCLASALALIAVAASGVFGPPYPLRAAIFALGASNGAFAVAAIGSMMSLAGAGLAAREGTRMGLWGAAQALAFGLGGAAATFGVDVARRFISAPATSYAIVFVGEAVLFVAAAILARGLAGPTRASAPARAIRRADEPVAAGA